MTTLSIQQGLAMCFFAALTGCGGGGSSPPPPTNVSSPTPPPAPAPTPSFPAPTSAAPYYLATDRAGEWLEGTMPTATGAIRFFSGQLMVVDPASPTSPVALEAAGQWRTLAQVEEGVIDSAAGSISQLNPRFVVYQKDSRLYRLDLRRASWPPVPTLLSTLLSTQLCYGATAQAFADRQSPQKSVLVFAGAGADSICSTADDRWLVVRLDMSATDSPLEIGFSILGAMRTSTGAITSFVVRDGDRIRRVDPALTNPVELFSIGSSFELVHGVETAQVLRGNLLFIENNMLRAYNLATGSGPITLFALDPGECCVSQSTADADGVYFGVDIGFWDSTSARLLRVTPDLAVDLLATNSAGTISELFATPTRLIYASRQATPMTHRSIPKSGGASTILMSGLSCPQTVVAGDQVWFSCLGGAGQVRVVRSDGGDEAVLANATIVATSQLNPLPLLPVSSTTYSVVIANNLRAPPATVTLGSANLLAYEASTRNELIAYGGLPYNWLTGFVGLAGPSQWGSPGLLLAEGVTQLPIGNGLYRDGLYRDILFYQSDAAGVTMVTRGVQ